MSAQSLVEKLYRGKRLAPRCPVKGLKPRAADNICDCDSSGECCSN